MPLSVPCQKSVNRLFSDLLSMVGGPYGTIQLRAAQFILLLSEDLIFKLVMKISIFFSSLSLVFNLLIFQRLKMFSSAPS